jgi:hypothetical protein
MCSTVCTPQRDDCTLAPLPTQAAPAPGSWCEVAPLWHYPLLPGGGLTAQRPGSRVHLLWGMPQPHTVGNLLASKQNLRLLWGHFPIHRFHERLLACAEACDQLPEGWVAAARAAAAAGPLPTPLAYAQVALRHVGWQRGRPAVSAAQLIVKTAMVLQMDHAERRQRHAQVAQLLSQQPAPRDAEAADSVTRLWPLLWGVHCRNSTKEVFRRLAGNALPTADEMAATAPCICDAAGPPQSTRAHIFWQCPMAQAVLTAVQQELQAWQQQQQQPPAAEQAAAAEPQAPAHLACTTAAGGVRRSLAAVVPLRGVCVWFRMACGLWQEGPVGHVGIGRRPPARAVAVFWAQLQHFCQSGMASAAWRQRAASGPDSGSVEGQTPGLSSGWRAAACELSENNN